MAGGFVFKRGTTFVFVLQAQDDTTGNPHDLSTSTVTSQLRDSLGNLVATLTGVPDPQVIGWVRLSYSGATDAWPLGLLSCDIKVTNQDGSIWATETITVQVVAQVTQ